MVFNYSKLRGRIVEICGSQSNFATNMGLSERSVSLKLNNERTFRQEEIIKAAKILGITSTEINEYFFKV